MSVIEVNNLTKDYGSGRGVSGSNWRNWLRSRKH